MREDVKNLLYSRTLGGVCSFAIRAATHKHEIYTGDILASRTLHRRLASEEPNLPTAPPEVTDPEIEP